MGSIAEKLTYTINAVDDIQLAIEQMGVGIDDAVELGYYGDKIREIANVNGNNIKDFYVLEKFEGISRMDIMPKTINDVSDLVITGNLDNLDTLDCLTFGSFEAFPSTSISAKDIEDISSNYSF